MSYVKKLLEKTNKAIKLPPTVMDTKFLTPEEIVDIKSKVLKLKSHWQYLVKDTDIEIPVGMMPLGRYSRSFDEYLKNAQELESIMLDNFSFYYKKIKLTIENHFGIKSEFLKKASLPGFHIFELNSKYDQGAYTSYNFHKDKFTFPNIQIGKIFSFVVPICLPNNQTGLIYTLDNTSSRHSKDENCVYNIQYYTEGSLIKWDGNLKHAISPFSLRKGEHRITLQFHVNLTNESAAIFW